jgi:L-galactono-1,5-lactonase
MGVEMIIDAHVHLWETQNGRLNGKPVFALSGGRCDFGGEIRQMLPPYLYDGKNPAEALIANMDYAGVGGCVVTQEYIDGNQDAYLLTVKAKYPERIKICSLYEEKDGLLTDDFDGIKICAGRLENQDLRACYQVFKKAEEAGKFISIDLAEGSIQTEAMEELIKSCPDLKIAIGHFGMVTVEGWREQIKLARNKNVFIESGGITWLFNHEFYPYESAVRSILEAGDICGMEKLMWGSDYPRTMTAITYLMSLDFVLKSKLLTEQEKKLFSGDNAKEFYGFKEVLVPEKVKNMVE